MKPRYLILIAPLLFVFCEKVMSSDEDVVIITSKSSPIYKFNRDDVRGIFSMRFQKWGENEINNVFILPKSHPSHVSLCKKILNVLPYRLQRNWDRLIYTGTGQSPIVVKDVDEMILLVGANPGSIGYVDRRYVDKNIVREIFIN
jgi:ABC-type phosphate transport system substrate-binding protein